MKGIKLVLFDVDDTLYDFERNWQHTVESVFLSHPLTSEFEQERICRLFNHYSQLHWDKTVRGELNFRAVPPLALQETLEEFGKTLLDEAFDSFTQAFIETSLSHLQGDDTVRSVIKADQSTLWAWNYYEWCNYTAREKLTRLGLGDLFPVHAVIVSSDVGVAKPDPAIFELALDRLGYLAEETVFVGDSWQADMVGAMNAGLHAIWFNRKGAEPLTAHEPIAIIKQLSELDRILSEAFSRKF